MCASREIFFAGRGDSLLTPNWFQWWQSWRGTHIDDWLLNEGPQEGTLLNIVVV